MLVTGYAGYIGSHLTKMLMDDGKYEVCGLDKVRGVTKPHTTYICDITQPFVIQPSFDTIIHLAALVNVGESERIPVEYYNTNLIGTMNVLNFTDCTNFVFASTGAAAGCASAYGISKRAAEDVVRDMCKKRGLDYTTFRFYNVIGTDGIQPSNPDGLMYNLIKAKETKEFNLYGNDYNTKDGTCIRDYVHVNEVCHSLVLAVDESSNSIENLGHGIGHSVKEMIDIFKEVNNCDFKVNICPRRIGDIEQSVLDNPSKFMQKLYSVEELLKV